MAKALTATAKDLQGFEGRRVKRQLDRPTPFTEKGTAITPARKGQLKASVFYKSIQAGYLEKQEEGGTRQPRGRAVVVPVGARLNRYGNMTRGQVRQLLARPDTFSGQVGRAAGIFQRLKGGRLKLLVAYEPRVSYRPRLGFRPAMAQRSRRRLPVELARAMRQAIATAR